MLRSCDECGSRLGVKVYKDRGTNASFRACWRPKHRQRARTALARQVAKLNIRLR